MKERAWRMLALAPLAILGLVVFVALGGWIVQSLWNWLLPPLFGWRAVTFWQALAMLALCRILFGGFGVHPRPRPRWRDHLRERWESMTPEERERFRKGLWGHFGAAPSAGENPQP